jgi:Holliday junction resolvase RusA-like endonuclease
MVKITLPGIPVPQARIRLSKWGTYDPNAKQKKHIRELLMCKAGLHMFSHPRISFLFHFPIPKAIKKSERALYESGLLKHEKKPDTDNLVKLYLDCIDGIYLVGDQKVSLGPCVKTYHTDPKTIIWITETTQLLQAWELDLAFQVDE